MSTLWVIGDSTVSSFEDKYYYPSCLLYTSDAADEL